MIYKQLYEIPLSRFISMYCGDLKALVINGRHSKEELEQTASRLIAKYCKVTGGRSIEADISMRNDFINCDCKAHCLEVALQLANAGMYEGACDIMESFGYKLKFGTPEEILHSKNKIQGLFSESKMRCDLLSEKLKSKTDGGIKVDRDYFEREKAIVMSYFKPFDDNEVKAETYAYWLNLISSQLKVKKIKK